MLHMTNKLQGFSAISLEEMGKVRLMNRIDTKYVTTLPQLGMLLERIGEDYRVQQIDGMMNMPYYTCYFDTPACDIFSEHQRGRKARQKIRLRIYESSQTAFLEIKNKNNCGRTDKQRIPAGTEKDAAPYAEWIRKHSRYRAEDLGPKVQNRFNRVTLVNKGMTERLTIDTGLCFSNLVTGTECSPEGLVIIELKRSGNTVSPAAGILRELHIHPGGFSKYCMGMGLTDGQVKQNLLKEKLRMVRRLCPELSYGDTGRFK